MSRVKFAAAFACVALGVSSVEAAIIDDFSSGSLSAYTQTVVLDNNGTRNVSFAIANEGLTSVATATTQAEQVLFLRADQKLLAGNVLRVDVLNWAQGSQDFGIAVSATAAPTITNLNGSQRANYIISSMRTNNFQALATGFDGTTALTGSPPPQVQTGGPIVGLFIRRPSDTLFEAGYTRDGVDSVLATLTVTNTAIGNAVGFYTDRRAAGTLGTLDNLRVDAIPEPGSLALLGMGGLALLRRRRAL